uniref:Uncharacterized protein n=1 Tax=uncultured Desulfobacterium sp. TaxID=201089 RepID=E1YJU3_9BACT|nr:unknown protein [uncultured Desulfobacterium sp.]
MVKLDEIILQMKQNPKGVRFIDLCKVCDHFFGTNKGQANYGKGKHWRRILIILVIQPTEYGKTGGL